MTATIKIQLDWVYEGYGENPADLSSTADVVVTLVSDGSGSEWPVIELNGTYDAVRDWMLVHYATDPGEVHELLELAE